MVYSPPSTNRMAVNRPWRSWAVMYALAMSWILAERSWLARVIGEGAYPWFEAPHDSGLRGNAGSALWADEAIGIHPASCSR
jgi:hypothetical protein